MCPRKYQGYCRTTVPFVPFDSHSLYLAVQLGRIHLRMTNMDARTYSYLALWLTLCIFRLETIS